MRGASAGIEPGLEKGFSEFQSLSAPRIRRFFKEGLREGASIDLHVLTDASMTAYVAAVYVRSEGASGNVLVTLAMEKARPAPFGNPCFSLNCVEQSWGLGSEDSRLYSKCWSRENQVSNRLNERHLLVGPLPRSAVHSGGWQSHFRDFRIRNPRKSITFPVRAIPPIFFLVA